MTRLSSKVYVSHHHQLKQLWEQDHRIFSCLAPNDQLDLHKYFLFALEKTDQELLDHRQNVKIGDPSLTNRAGKAYAKLMRGDKAPVGHFAIGHDGRHIYVRPVMHPEPKGELLAKAFLYLAIEENKQKTDNDVGAAI